MKIRTTLFVAAAILAGGSGLAGAEPPRPPQVIADALPPYEVATIIRSSGFIPVGRPVRRGHFYEIQAIDPYDMNVRVAVDARSGRILSVEDATLAAAYARGPVPYGLRPPPYRLGWAFHGEPPPPLPPRAIPGTRATRAVAPLPRVRPETAAPPAQLAAKPAEVTGSTPAAKPPEATSPAATKPAETAPSALPPVQPLD